MKLRFAALWIALLASVSVVAQSITGVVRDQGNNETVFGATVAEKGTTNGAITDIDGKFELKLNHPAPATLVISFVGYVSKEIVVTDYSKPLSLKLAAKDIELKGVEVSESRVTEKQKEAPLTVESMDIIAIKECPQNSFYEALGTLKGVDLTSASLGFTVVNTRGFNSTSPVRSLQLIDGVDNQSPGLNFSLGNFLGACDLDVMKVDLVAGASSAYYGPNAFNGVISMTSRSPFIKPGLEVSAKFGERNLMETAVRWAQVIKNKNGEEKLAYKLNLFFLRANDWEANNMSASTDSRSDTHNPGGYDAVNVYGDEYYATSDFTAIPNSRPGVMIYYRTGYAEKDLVDYKTQNIKSALALHYKVKKDVELIGGTSFGTGTTVYQGDNRYSLKDILFFQHKLELKKEGKFFVRVYMTQEDAGKSYDSYFTALLMQSAAKSDEDWSKDYINFWSLPGINYYNKERNFPGYPVQPLLANYNGDTAAYQAAYTSWQASINPFLMNNYYDSLVLYHNNASLYADTLTNAALNKFPFYVPGTSRFDSLFALITSRKSFSEGGSRFYDKSKLYHAQAEYKFTPAFGDVITGANMRWYRPESDGTIFSDTSGRKITNYEFGVYAGLEKKLSKDKLKVNITARMDKNENFDYLFSPAASLVYTLNANNIFRFSFSSAIRNPTLTDQYLFYNVGRAKLIGNISGYDSLVTVQSIRDFYTGYADAAKLKYFNVDPVRPEKVKTFEVGYRASLFNKIYLDANYYYSLYTDFIGYVIGAKVTPTYTSIGGWKLSIDDIYRVASNATDQVSSMGFSIGINYYLGKKYTLNANYSWNELNKRGSDDPIIPAFNTPKNKYNIGLSARDLEFAQLKLNNVSFNINYKWVQGFLFEGSPQFTGAIESYDIVDVQVSKKIPKIHSTFKIGASNLLNNLHYEVYGGPLVGRLAYAAVLVELN
ncbi:MAG: TonB-dependent receptor [Bacteroidia bacterium]